MNPEQFEGRILFMSMFKDKVNISVIETAGSARNWFFGTQPHEDRGSRWKQLASATIQDAGSC